MNRALPNFVYVGTDKAGSTWLHEVLRWHPECYVTPAKDIYFFDRYHDRGLDWYRSHFEAPASARIVGEISHDYMYSTAALERLHATLPSARVMVTLREPADRAFSVYLYMRKVGFFDGSFREAIERHGRYLVEHGLYAEPIRQCLDRFGRDRVHVALFDDLRADPATFAASLTGFLGVAPRALPPELNRAVLGAGRSRSVAVTRMLRRAGGWLRDRGHGRVVGRVKSWPLLHRVLYAAYRKKPEADREELARLRRDFAEDVARLDALTGVPVSRRWGYRAPMSEPSDRCSAVLESVRDRILRFAERAGRRMNSADRAMLDVGCWDGEFSRAIAQRAGIERVHGLEVFPEQIEQARGRGLEVHSVDLESGTFGLPDEQFDLVVCNQVFEHLKHVFDIIDEIHRVLRPGGYLIFSVPNLASFHNRVMLLAGYQPSSIRVFGPHVRGFSYRATSAFLTHGGHFRIEDVAGVGFYPFPTRGLGNALGGVWKSGSHTPVFLVRRTSPSGASPTWKRTIREMELQSTF